MGWEWEVSVWLYSDVVDNYFWEQVYAGQSERKAKAARLQANRDHPGHAIQIVWRP